MSPKKLLRLPEAKSSFADMLEGEYFVAKFLSQIHVFSFFTKMACVYQ